MERQKSLGKGREEIYQKLNLFNDWQRFQSSYRLHVPSLCICQAHTVTLVVMTHGEVDVFTSTVSRYCIIKYQTCEAVSMSKNWNPAGLITGDAPGVSLLQKSQKHEKDN